MTTTYEVWAPKGDARLLTFASYGDAVKYTNDRGQAVPGLRLFEITRIARQLAVGVPAKAERRAA